MDKLSPLETYLLIAAAPIVATILGRVLVDIYHHVIPWVKTRFGIELPDSPEIDSDIEQAVKILLPAQLKLIEAGQSTLPNVVDTLVDSIKAVHPDADTSAVAQHVISNLPDHQLVLKPAAPADSSKAVASATASVPIPGLDRTP